MIISKRDLDPLFNAIVVEFSIENAIFLRKENENSFAIEYIINIDETFSRNYRADKSEITVSIDYRIWMIYIYIYIDAA